jgi:hypothetical protein
VTLGEQSQMVNTKVQINKFPGVRRTVWLPTPLDQKAEQIRKHLGLGRSAFYRFTIVEVVKQFEIVSKSIGEQKP